MSRMTSWWMGLTAVTLGYGKARPVGMGKTLLNRDEAVRLVVA